MRSFQLLGLLALSFQAAMAQTVTYTEIQNDSSATGYLAAMAAFPIDADELDDHRVGSGHVEVNGGVEYTGSMGTSQAGGSAVAGQAGPSTYASTNVQGQFTASGFIAVSDANMTSKSVTKYLISEPSEPLDPGEVIVITGTISLNSTGLHDVSGEHEAGGFGTALAVRHGQEHTTGVVVNVLAGTTIQVDVPPSGGLTMGWSQVVEPGIYNVSALAMNDFHISGVRTGDTTGGEGYANFAIDDVFVVDSATLPEMTTLFMTEIP